MTVWLLRHGMTADNALGRYQGRRDTPLSPEGVRALRPADFSPATVYVSPLRRAVQTAQILFPAAALVTVGDLAEMDFGDFDGKTADEMAGDPAYRAWVEQGCSTRCPNGETRAEFCSRSCRAFAALVEQAAAEGRESLVIVAHGGTLRAVMERFSEPQFAFFALPTPFGGGYVLEYDAALWQRERKLRLLRAVSREGESAAC